MLSFPDWYTEASAIVVTIALALTVLVLFLLALDNLLTYHDRWLRAAATYDLYCTRKGIVIDKTRKGNDSLRTHWQALAFLGYARWRMKHGYNPKTP